MVDPIKLFCYPGSTINILAPPGIFGGDRVLSRKIYDDQRFSTLRRVKTLTDRRESISYPTWSGGQPANDTYSADQLQLPPNWQTARDHEGQVYYYHTKTRVSQWHPPSEFQYSHYEDYSPVLKNNGETDKEKSVSHAEKTAGSEKIPLITEQEHIISPREPIDKEEIIKRIRNLKEKLRKHKKPKLMNGNTNGSKGNSKGHVSSNNTKLVSAPADTSSITERKKKYEFRTHMANFVVSCLNPYFHASCTKGRITNDKDFKHLARKFTHFVMLKELKYCQNVTDLTCNSRVKHKAKEFITNYMGKFGDVYVRPPDDANY